MARIALIKLFTGLNLAPAQLSGELLRAGHDSRIIYFKEYEVHPAEDAKNYEVSELSGQIFSADGREVVCNCYTAFSEKDYKMLVSELRMFKPQLIGFSAHSGIIEECALVTRKLKEHFDVPVIWGGAGPTLEPERCIEHTDIVCINEGEEVIVEMADRIDRGQSLDDVRGTWFKRTNGEIIKHETRPNIPLNNIAIPNWNLDDIVQIKGQRHSGLPLSNLGTDYPIMTQRGCPFSCSFCIESRYQEMFGRKDSLRRRDVDLVMEELLYAKENLNIETVLFYDDVFTVNPRWLDEFLPRYKEEIGLPFWCYTYPTTHTRELLQKLKDAGCTSITMGVQSGSERILREYYNRPTKMSRVIEAGQEIVDVGLTAFFDLITINEFDTEEDLRNTFEFLLEFPREIRCQAYGEMIGFPTYSFTRMSEENAKAAADPNAIAVSQGLPRATYDYYHRLFRLTRTEMPTEQMREIGEDPQYRENPELIDKYLESRRFYRFTAPASIAPQKDISTEAARTANASMTPSASGV